MSDIQTTLNQIIPNALSRTANADLSTTGRSGVMAGTQTSDNNQANSMGTIALIAVADQNNNNGANAYGVYAQVNIEPGSTGGTEGEEIGVINSSGAAPRETSINANPAGASRALRLGAGRPDEVSGPVSAALDIENVSGKPGVGFEEGIVFGAGSLLPDDKGNLIAEDYAVGDSQVWRGPDGAIRFQVRSDNATGPLTKMLVANDGSINFQNAAGQNWLSFIPSGASGCVVMTNNRTTRIF